MLPNHPRPGQLHSGLVWLVALLATVLLLDGSIPLHVHEADTAGFYNQTHVLVSLATMSGGAPLPGAVSPAWLPLLADRAPSLHPTTLPAPALPHAKSRAPPSA